jgi:predicted 2-oxoglutarate/Fe(II)-dependent dioxygenase YbiX
MVPLQKSGPAVFTARCRNAIAQLWQVDQQQRGPGGKMLSMAKSLAALLDEVQRPGDFYTSGTHEISAPGLEIDEVGPIALPLLMVQAAQLIAVAERAPYGRGEQTLVDTAVRRSWQIDRDKVQIRGRGWARTLEAIVARAAEGLGVTGPVTAEFYKLLVYEPGSFFVNHRDSEKTPGMFATLVIVLPSIHTGGELVIRHQDREVRVDPRCDEPSDAGFLAFYADCVHEVLPITSGCRLTLVYNLLRPGRGAEPTPPSYTSEQGHLAALLRRWSGQKAEAGDTSPEKLIYPLEHSYTLESLSFEALKGADAAKAATLLAAAGAAGCDLYLALVSIEESGSAEYTGDYRSYRRGGDSEDDFEEIEVIDRYESLSGWRKAGGGEVTLGELPITKDEISPPDALADLAPDEENFHEATGNEGASFERSYRRAALVLWPIHRRLAVMSQGGLPATLPYLAELTQEWIKAGEVPGSPLWRQAHELAGHMIAGWPRDDQGARNAPSHGATMLELLGRLGDTERSCQFLANVVAGGIFGRQDNEQIVQTLRQLSPSSAAELLERIIFNNAGKAIGSCVDLLARSVGAAWGEYDMRPAATALVAALPGDPARTPDVPAWQRSQPVESQIVVDALTALPQIDPALADIATGIFLRRPKTYDADMVLIPAGLALSHSAAASATAVISLRNACIAHLRARIAEPLAPPADWTRNSKLICKCRHCGELSRFLAEANSRVWNFKAIQADRSHVESTIRQSNCDLNTATIRRGSPHILECTKNQASYERGARQRKKDLQDLGLVVN